MENIDEKTKICKICGYMKQWHNKDGTQTYNVNINGDITNRLMCEGFAI